MRGLDPPEGRRTGDSQRSEEDPGVRDRRAEWQPIMKALVESAGKVASKGRLGDHELLFDQPATVPGGDDRGPSPLDVLAVSVAACAHYYAAAYLHGRGLSTEALSVETEFEKERPRRRGSDGSRSRSICLWAC